MADMPDLSFNQSDIDALTPAGKEQLRGQLLAAGFDSSAMQERLGAAEQPAKSPPTFQQVNADGGKLVLRGQGDEGISPETKLSAYKNLIQHGSDPDAAINSALADGFTPQQLGLDALAPPPEPTGDAALDALAPPASPNDYKVTLPSFMAGEADAGDIGQVVGALRQGFHALEVPAAYSDSLAGAIFEAVHNGPDEGEDEAAVKLRFLAEGAKIKRLSNGEEIAAAADRFQVALKKADPEVFDMIADNWGFHSAAALIAAGQAQLAIEQRQARRKS